MYIQRALQIEFHNHKNTFLSQFHCLSFSISQIFHSLSSNLFLFVFNNFYVSNMFLRVASVFIFWPFLFPTSFSLQLIIEIFSSIPFVPLTLHANRFLTHHYGCFHLSILFSFQRFKYFSSFGFDLHLLLLFFF